MYTGGCRANGMVSPFSIPLFLAMRANMNAQVVSHRFVVAYLIKYMNKDDHAEVEVQKMDSTSARVSTKRPKKTGRKRKRGDDGSATAHAPARCEADKQKEEQTADAHRKTIVGRKLPEPELVFNMLRLKYVHCSVQFRYLGLHPCGERLVTEKWTRKQVTHPLLVASGIYV